MSEFDNGFEGAQEGAYQASINRFVEGDKQRVNKSEEIKSQGNGNAGRIEILPESRRAYRRVVVGCGLVLIVGKDILIDRRKIWVLLHWKRPLWLVWAKIPTKDGLFLCLSNIRFYLHSKHEEGKGQTKMSHLKIRDDSCRSLETPKTAKGTGRARLGQVYSYLQDPRTGRQRYPGCTGCDFYKST